MDIPKPLPCLRSQQPPAFRPRRTDSLIITPIFYDTQTSQEAHFRAMEPITDIPTYLRAHAQELGTRILQSYPPLHSIDDLPSPMIGKLLRKPYPAQTLAIMGLVRRWQQARAGAVIAECGTGKTLISLGAVQTHAENRPFTAVAMV